ncbi:MAG TPA: glutathionylspermidine synthase family protein [Bacillota bacterium]|nr:glutathionylspermidine synthase family protein [Bacillota bacterium]
MEGKAVEDKMNRVVALPVNLQTLFSGERAKRIPYHHMYGKPYCLPYTIVYSEEEYKEITAASEQLDRIYCKTLRFTQRHLPDPFFINQLGIHPALIPCSRIEVQYHGVSRQDWIINRDGMKLIENNTDTPTGIPETAYLSGSIIEDYTQLKNPSHRMDPTIQQAFQRLIDYYIEHGYSGRIAFSCYDWHEEDRCNTLYLMEQARKVTDQVRFAPIEELEVIPDVGLFYQGEKIEIWYRLYPLEYLVHDVAPDGFPTGMAILRLIENGKLAIINPAQSIITQSKGFLALLWGLYEQSDFFTEEECKMIQSYCLPTYFHDQYFQDQGMPYVAKALFGREGKGTTLMNEKGEKEEILWGEDQEEEWATRTYYMEQPKIFQQQIPMEKVHLSDEGEGYLLSGVFVIGGQCCAIMPRIGGKITGNMANFCPAGIQVEKGEG